MSGWHLRGTTLEACNCDPICPCRRIDGVPGGPMHAVFIRAPWVAERGPEVEVLASVDEHPVAIRQGNMVAVSFHPELSGDDRLHAMLLAMNGAQ